MIALTEAAARTRLDRKPRTQLPAMGRHRAAVGLLVLAVMCRLAPLAHGGGDEGGAAAVRAAALCTPWPDCVAQWVEAAVQERARAGAPLDEAKQDIRQGWEQNCSRTAQCTVDARLEEIDQILSRVQTKWEKQAGGALAARSTVEDSLWKRWIQQAQDRVKDTERLVRARTDEEAALTDIWVRRMSTISLDASLLPMPPARVHSANGSSSVAVPSAAEGAAPQNAGWERGGALRDASLNASWYMSAETAPNLTRAAVISQVHSASRCMLRELLDMALEEGDAMHASCPPNGKGDCFEVCSALVSSAPVVLRPVRAACARPQRACVHQRAAVRGPAGIGSVGRGVGEGGESRAGTWRGGGHEGLTTSGMCAGLTKAWHGLLPPAPVQPPGTCGHPRRTYEKCSGASDTAR